MSLCRICLANTSMRIDRCRISPFYKPQWIKRSRVEHQAVTTKRDTCFVPPGARTHHHQGLAKKIKVNVVKPLGTATVL